jgi:hypothetical protein
MIGGQAGVRDGCATPWMRVRLGYQHSPRAIRSISEVSTLSMHKRQLQPLQAINRPFGARKMEEINGQLSINPITHAHFSMELISGTTAVGCCLEILMKMDE